jgi:hypothetical protein
VRRTLLIPLAATTVLFTGAAPANATTARGGWVPEPIPPFDAAAGVLCDFPVHYDVLVNHVRTKVVSTYPDGTPKRQLATGALLLNVGNPTTGATKVVDAGGSAVIDHGTDGSMLWHVVGPVIARLGAGTSNLPRGLYTIDGVYRVAFSPTGFKTITLTHGRIHDLCPDLA